jgi:hypothetical protein
MSRATDAIFDQLHGLLADTLIEQIKVYTEAKDEAGKPAPQAIPPALLAQCIKFLKDNGIDSPSRGKKVDEALPPGLPCFEEVLDEHMRAH